MTDRPTLDDLDTDPAEGPWCCSGNAEDCALCTDPNPPYPFLCPGHPRTAGNERIVGKATEATEATEPAADALCAELYRRTCRLQTLNSDTRQWEHVYGETVGLRGAIGIVLGHEVTGSADEAGQAYYQAWLQRREGSQ
jgi:hypothetical protein